MLWTDTEQGRGPGPPLTSTGGSEYFVERSRGRGPRPAPDSGLLSGGGLRSRRAGLHSPKLDVRLPWKMGTGLGGDS